MSDVWTRHDDPDREHVVEGLPAEVVTEVERLAEQPTVLGPDAAQAGHGRVEGGGLRTIELFGGRGFFLCPAVEGLRVISIVRVV